MRSNSMTSLLLFFLLLILGIENGLIYAISQTFVSEDDAEKKMLINMFHIDHITPFIRIGLASLTAFAAGSVTSLVMLHTQNSDSISDRISGTELKLDMKESHLLRNSIIAVTTMAILVIAGLRTYSVISYRNDRKEYEKAGYLNLVESNGFKMNVYSTGAENGKHTIVGLAGQGSFAFPVETTELRTCPHRYSCTSFRQILPVTALKILEGQQPGGGFLPCHRQNYA